VRRADTNGQKVDEHAPCRGKRGVVSQNTAGSDKREKTEYGRRVKAWRGLGAFR